MRIAIDSGGTFTDCVYLEDAQLKVFKLFSTPHNPGQAVLDAVLKVTPANDPAPELRHGTTVGTNAMLERKGARVAYVTTAGFEDVIAIGRQARPSLYDWSRSPLPCIVPAALRFGVDERTTAEGAILRSPSPEHLADLAARIRDSGAESIALSLLFAFVNPANERLVAEALAPLGLPLSIAHQILPEFREYERAATVVTNAYLAPKVSSYIRQLAASLTGRFPAGSVHVMQSSGGIVSAALAAREPVRTVLSGPAGGVIGAYRVAQLAGFPKIIAFDMGGTSTDVALIDAADGGPSTTGESIVSELPLGLPMLDIHTVGAGGGSLARFDAAGLLHVGPHSAGAVPGPICYGQGEHATVTDANLALGRLDPDLFLGGELRLDAPRARARMEDQRGPLASIERYAAGILALAETAMEKAIRVISVERGHDPRDFTLVCFGGAGPLHACSLARDLRIPRVLVPAMPGALSALGILMADVVRDYSRTVMLPPDPVALEPAFRELEARGTRELTAEGLTGTAVRSADLRYTGQGYELNIPAAGDLLTHFHDAHRKRYGYADPAKPVEVVNVRLRLTAKTPTIDLPRHSLRAGDGTQALLKTSPIYFDGAWHPANVYDRDRLHPGDHFPGPALITEYSATTVLPPACRLHVDEYRNLVIELDQFHPNNSCHSERSEESPYFVHAATNAPAPDPIELAVFQSATHSIAEEMGAVLRRTSFSPNIKERRDYSCALFTADAQVLAMGDHMPVHLGSMPMSVRAALDALTLGPGDIALLNDPYAGGTHLPDLTMVLPVFAPGESAPILYVAARAHHADIGGMYPGSMGLCREIYQEGLRLPPVKLVEAGQVNQAILQIILHNVRTPAEREGDLMSQIGACRVGEARLQELLAKHGPTRLRRLATDLLDSTERLMRAQLAATPAGTFTAEDFLDSDGFDPAETPLRIRAAITIDPTARTARLDFAGSCPQVESSLNAVFAITYSAVFYVFRCLLPEDAPATAGLMRPITVLAPSGSIVNAVLPAPVAGGNVETSQRIVDVLLRALAQALPSRIPAASSGTMNNLTIGGTDPRTGRPFAYYETIAGGMGARPTADGVSGIHTHMTNSANTPVEALEYAYPFRVRSYSYRPGSGGAGQYRGGDGIVREIEVTTPARLTLLTDRRRFPPYGLAGGAPGALGRSLLLTDAEAKELPSKCSLDAQPGDRIRIETPGGGGWGTSPVGQD